MVIIIFLFLPLGIAGLITYFITVKIDNFMGALTLGVPKFVLLSLIK